MLADAAESTQSATDVPWYQSLASSLQSLATGYLTVQQQQQLDALNVERAKQGLAPIDTAQYQTGVNVGVSSSTQNTILIVVGVLGAAWVLSSMMGRRR
jgi:hypothetical protein